MKRLIVAAVAALMLTGCSVSTAGVAIGPKLTKEERYIQALKDRDLPVIDDPAKAKAAAQVTCDLISADVPQWMIAEQITESTSLDAAQALAFLSVTREFYCPGGGGSS